MGKVLSGEKEGVAEVKAYSGEFAKMILDVLAETGLTADRIEVAALSSEGGAVSNTTVRRMSRGVPPSSDLIVAFARAVGEHQGWSWKRVQKLADALLEEAGSEVRYRPPVNGRSASPDGSSGKGGANPKVGYAADSGAFRDQTSVRPRRELVTCPG